MFAQAHSGEMHSDFWDKAVKVIKELIFSVETRRVYLVS